MTNRAMRREIAERCGGALTTTTGTGRESYARRVNVYRIDLGYRRGEDLVCSFEVSGCPPHAGADHYALRTVLELLRGPLAQIPSTFAARHHAFP